MARIANTLSTSLPALHDMPWDSVLRYYPEAAKIHAETWGLRR